MKQTIVIALAIALVGGCATNLKQPNVRRPEVLDLCQNIGLDNVAVGSLVSVRGIYFSDQLHGYFSDRGCQNRGMTISFGSMSASREEDHKAYANSIRMGRSGLVETPIIYIGEVRLQEESSAKRLEIQDFAIPD